MGIQMKAVIVGDGAIGKSCLVDAIQFPEREISTEYKPTIAENTTLNWDNDGESVVCDFWDTAGQEQFGSLRVMAYNGANVIIVGFKMTDPDSLNNIEAEGGWVDEVEEKLPGFQHWILCGTQYDLWDKNNSEHCQEAKIHEVAERIGARNLMYTSAYTKHNCKAMQREICRIGSQSAKGEPTTAWISELLHPKEEDSSNVQSKAANSMASIREESNNGSSTTTTAPASAPTTTETRAAEDKDTTKKADNACCVLM